MIRGAILALLVLSLSGCKKKAPEGASIVLEYRDRICACKDLACANKLNDEFAKRVSDTRRADEGPLDERVMKQIQDCATKLYTPSEAGSGSAAAAGSGSDTSQPPLPTMPAVRQADLLISLVRGWQKSPKLALDEIQISYVDADGVLDGEFGVLMVRFGTASGPVDDPKRKTGAPVKVDETKPTSCPTIYAQLDGWRLEDSFCRHDARPYIPRCTVVDVWKRALKLGAPKDALAVITFHNVETPTATWQFVITDGPRGVNFTNVFHDDCERTLEKSPQ